MRVVQKATIVAIILCCCASPASAQMPMLRLPATTPTRGDSPSLPAAPQSNRRFTRLPPATQTLASQAPAIQAPPIQAPMAQMATIEQRLADVTGWWEPYVGAPQSSDAKAVEVTANELIVHALVQSEHVLAVRQGPIIQQENVLRAIADFDPAVFLETRWDDLSNPVGNTLTTGGPNRFNDHHWVNKGGLRKKTNLGGTIELSQDIGLQDTNSLFFIPAQQAATRMTLSLNQPLLRRAGREYNESAILLAEVQTNIAEQDLNRDLQDHAFAVIQAYWDLYLQRALTLQRHRAHDQAVKILAELERREQIDLLRSQIARARAAVAIRRANTQRAMLATRTAQQRIVALTNNPLWQDTAAVELTPVEAPATARGAVDPHAALQTALEFRPDVAKHLSEIREAQIRFGISKNELMPTLDLVLQTYVAGLDGDYDVGSSLGNQFTVGAPSYSAGLVFQVPIGNRAAQAEYRRREAKVNQLVHELNAVLSQVTLEVAAAVNEVEAAYQELQGRYEAMIATDEELHYLFDRWRLFPGEDRAVSFLLEDLLDAQDRQMEAESNFVRAQVAYTISHFNLQRASGSLLHFGQPTQFANPSEPIAAPAAAFPAFPPAP